MSDTPSFSEQMRTRADRTWRAILRHRFFREVATDTINDRIFARYLRIEYGFVDSAARALGYAVAKAPSFQERRRLGLWLYGLVTDQEQVFVDAFERMGALPMSEPASRRRGSLCHCTRFFSTWPRRRAMRRSSPALWRREGMYLTWCSTANRSPSSRGYIRDWVALYAGGAFAEHVARVRSEIDTRAPALAEVRKARLGALFEEALLAEIAFHDAPYAA